MGQGSNPVMRRIVSELDQNVFVVNVCDISVVMCARVQHEGIGYC